MPGMRVRYLSSPMLGTVTGYASPIRGRIDVAWDGGVHDCRTDPGQGILPDLSDPATAGCLLAMLPAGWTIDPSGNNGFRVTINDTPTGPVDYVDRDDDARTWFHVVGATLGEAVARALLACWGASSG